MQRSILAAIGATLFGATTQAEPVDARIAHTDAEAPQSRHAPHRRAERNDSVFRTERQRIAWCEATERLIERWGRESGSDRVSAKFLRRLRLRVDAVRHPEMFDRRNV